MGRSLPHPGGRLEARLVRSGLTQCVNPIRTKKCHSSRVPARADHCRHTPAPGIVFAFDVTDVSKRTHSERGFTLIELLLVIAIIGVLAAIAGNRVMRARLSANESSAVASLRTINSGEANYSSTCGGGSYAVDLSDLSRPPIGSTAAFISPDLSSNGVVKSGYTFAVVRSGATGTIDSTMLPCNAATATPASGYHAAATPLNGLGGRHFATSNLGTIHQDSTTAIANPIPDGTTVVQ